MRISTAMLNGSAVSAILNDQNNLSNTQQELASGLSINSPSDNPVGAAQLLALDNISSQDAQYITNGQAANTNLTLEQTALSSSTSTMQSIRDLVLQANSGTNSPSDLKAIATQIQSLEQQLMSTANTKNDAGQYLFSGYMQTTQPFVRGASGSVSYAGDEGTSTIALDSGTSVQTGDPGSNIYMNVPAGNGTFTTSASSSNTGTGVIDTGSVADAANWTPGQYTIKFTDASDYEVLDSSGNPVTDGTGNPVTGTYNGSSGEVSFDGIEVGISGAPAAGDTFTVSSAGTQSIFTTLDNVVSALNSAGSSSAAQAQLATTLGGTVQQLDQGLNQVSTVATSVGTRIDLISSVNTSLTADSTAVTTQISNLSNVDYVSATSQYSQEYIALQAAEQSYAQLGQLSLFKYLA
jgi:flagellar hook-associated protein 3 FlgL